MQDDPEQSPIFRQRRVEARILGHVYATISAAHGAEEARRVIADAVRAAALEQAREMAEGRDTSLPDFKALTEQWSRGGALEIEEIAADETRLDFDVTRCRYAEMYREMGLAEIGPLLSCQRDGVFAEGYDPRIEMTRDQTIMQGAPRCTFRYRLRDSAAQAKEKT